MSSSSFPSLLRLTNIASYDPLITRVYTASPSSAARGDWGLKSSLPKPRPNRSRSRYIRVQSLDDGQGIGCDWRSAEKEARFMERWGNGRNGWIAVKESVEVETKARATLKNYKEFSPGSFTKDPEQPKHEDVLWMPEVEAMSEPEFERYLTELRASRPAFKSLPRSSDVSPSPIGTPTPAPTWHSDPGSMSATHQARTTSLKINSPSSSLLHPAPHPRFGLSYSRATHNTLQSNPSLEIPGRLLNPAIGRGEYLANKDRQVDNKLFGDSFYSPLDQNQNQKIVGAGGLTGRLAGSSNAGEYVLEMNADPTKTSTNLRISRAVIRSAPTVVSASSSGETPLDPLSVNDFAPASRARRPSPLETVKTDLSFTEVRGLDDGFATAIPGTKEWMLGTPTAISPSDRIGSTASLGSAISGITHPDTNTRDLPVADTKTLRALLSSLQKPAASESTPPSRARPTASVPSTPAKDDAISGPGIGAPEQTDGGDGVAQGGWRETEENVSGDEEHWTGIAGEGKGKKD